MTRGDVLARFGFGVEPFGDRTFLVRAVPAMLAGKGIAEAFKEAIDSLDDESAGAREEERIARDFIIKEKPDIVFLLVNAAALERSLYLLSEILILEVPVVIGLNLIPPPTTWA